MKRKFAVLAVVVLSGCAGTPEYKGRAFSGKNVWIVRGGDEMSFAIVTDGRVELGHFFPARGTYAGTIVPPTGRENVDFHAANGWLHIGSQSYELASGKLFLVSVAGEKTRVSQLVLKLDCVL